MVKHRANGHAQEVVNTGISLPQRTEFDARSVPSAVRRVMRILELEQTNVPTVDELARRVGWSSGYLSREFSAAFGESPAAYGRRNRLNHAATRLLFAPAPLGEIARSFGFEDQPAFNRAFRRQHGSAPGIFAKGRRAAMLPAVQLGSPPVVYLTRRPAESALCRRFFGSDIVAHWQRFFTELPAEIPKPNRYAGLIYDSPAVVPPLQQRYDCALPLTEINTLIPSSSTRAGLDVVELPGGVHAEIRGCLPQRVGAAIRHLYTNWLPNQPNLLPEGDPMVHWWGEATSGVTVTIRLHLVPDHPTWNMIPLDEAGVPLGSR